MNSEELRQRTKQFAINVISFVTTFPRTQASRIIGHQLIKSSTSIGANYRVACRAQSHAHFISKIHIVFEESDESPYWLEIPLVLKLGSEKRCRLLLNEAQELTAIFTAISKTAKRHK
jgi:four helix bundle protein